MLNVEGKEQVFVVLDFFFPSSNHLKVVSDSLLTHMVAQTIFFPYQRNMD